MRAMRTWSAVGCIGSAGLALTGSAVGSVPAPGHGLWWFAVARSSSVTLGCLFYASFALLLVAWLAVGRRARAGLLTGGQAWLVLALWAGPLALGPPLFSRDLYSYAAQGVIAHSGLNPYAVGPAVLGHGPLLDSVAAAWRHTPAPYGPLFVTATRWIAAIFGSSVTAEILALRVLELSAMAVIMRFLPRLARNLGADPGLALWLGVLSPLALLSFVASGHNDALMLALLVAGLTMVTDHRLVAGLVLCGLAATVKLPAVVAVLFIALWALRGQQGRHRLVVAAQVVTIPVATVVAVTWACGLGWAWLSPAAVEVPAQARTLLTPSVVVGTFLFHLLHLLRLPAHETSTVRVTQACCAVMAVTATIWLASRARTLDMVRLLGLAFIVIALAGPALWPWYLSWSVVALAATSAQRSKALVFIAAMAMLAVGPSGSPVVTGDADVVVLVAWVALGAWLVGRRHRLRPTTASPVASVGRALPVFTTD